jgi:hypothetical protein
MKNALYTFTLVSILSMQSAHAAASPVAEVYHCTPSSAQMEHEIDSVEVRKDPKTQLITTEVNVNSGVATVGYVSEVKYVENPNFAFPEWDGAGVTFITEKKARNFKADTFVGNISGMTPEFPFSANLACKKVPSSTSVASK